ncbi:HAMP domain-containing protein, partial [Mycobacterium tuberculosis]|nr:HAMP domain-containing protein [Mycobacterium tuberculosis]
AIGVGVWISLAAARGLAKAGDLAEAVARGDLGQNIAIKSNDEIRDLVDAMTRMTINLRATAAIADAIAAGDLRPDERDGFLAAMTDAVAERVLANNVGQTRAIG